MQTWAKNILPKIDVVPTSKNKSATSKSEAPFFFRCGPIIDSTVPNPNKMINWFTRGTMIFLEVVIFHNLKRFA